MANNFIQVAPDSTGKQLQTYMNVIGGNNVHSEAITLTDNTGNYVATLPVSIGSNLNVNGTVAATQIGTWNVGTITTLPSNSSFNLSQIVGATADTNSGTKSPGTLRVVLATDQPQLTNKLLVTPDANVAYNLSQIVGTTADTNTGNATNGTLRVVLASNQPNVAISGSVTANAGSNLNTALLATAANQTSGSEKTQICDPTNASNVAGITNSALNVYLQSITANSGTNLNTANISVKVFQGGAFLSSGQVANVSNVSTTIAASRATRRSVTIRNHDSTNSGYIGPAPIGVTNGLLLSPLDSVSVDFVGIIAGISATTSNVTFGYLETYD